ncbi:hypothetical protein AB0D04_37800 [Streptomyces sp. NPDC048483]|uniref:hypothetical protein n=1 Tax=Streptomyces sp. NPDC048483 TaxID=3154927 RepID=UPI0034458278
MEKLETLLYSAELIHQDGVYKLVVTDRLRGTVQTSQVSKKAVEKLPMFLSMLNSRQFSAFR